MQLRIRHAVGEYFAAVNPMSKTETSQAKLQELNVDLCHFSLVWGRQHGDPTGTQAAISVCSYKLPSVPATQAMQAMQAMQVAIETVVLVTTLPSPDCPSSVSTNIIFINTGLSIISIN